VPIQLNHTIAGATNKEDSAKFLVDILGAGTLVDYPPFLGVQLDNDVTIDFMDYGDFPITPLHYAFLVTEDEWDGIFARIQERSLNYWADPHRNQLGEINHHDGGRGVYWEGPDGHLYEAITRPYGSG
jgi:catechol 2,3-dioxygenase-like lactoylglutathione lyase family enzyme